MEQPNYQLILTEGNVLDIYKKLHGGNLTPDELSNVKNRFRELVNHNNTNGTKM